MTHWLPTSERKRGQYLGGPSMAAIMGDSRYQSAGDVYASIVHGVEVKPTKRMKRGLLLEASLVEHASKVRGVSLSRDCFYLDGFKGCSVDAVEGNVRSPKVLHEFKTTRSLSAHDEALERWGAEGSSDVDPACATQVQWEFGLTGAEVCHVWLYDLDVDDDPRHFVLRRSERRIGELRSAAEAFWAECVVPKVPPKIAPMSKDALSALWPPPKADTEFLPSHAVIKKAWDYHCARRDRDVAQKKMDLISPVLMQALDGRSAAVWPADPRYGIFAGSVRHIRYMLDEKTDYETMAYQMAAMFSVPGDVFNGLVRQNTTRFPSKPSLRVHISLPKQKVTE